MKMESKTVLMVVGVLVLLMGLLALVPAAKDFFGVQDPVWHALAKVLVGGFAIYVAYSDKKTA